MAWRRGEPGKGPHLIDKLGRVVKPTETSKPAKVIGEPKQYRPGQIGATIADLKDHGLWNELGDKTRLEYATYLKIFQDGIPDPARCASSTRPRSKPASCLPRTIPH
jgi:hypothetical protein